MASDDLSLKKTATDLSVTKDFIIKRAHHEVIDMLNVSKRNYIISSNNTHSNDLKF